MSKAEEASEKAAYIEKFFNCTEAPIKEWLATFLGKPVREVFEDFSDESEVIGFPHKNLHYTAYVVTMPPDTECLVDAEMMKECEKARKACSMLYDGVRQVFMSIVGSYNNAELTGLMPEFIESKMAFRLRKINTKCMQLQMALQQRTQLMELLKSTQSDPTKQTAEIADMIDQGMQQVQKILSENTKEVLDKEEELCKQVNQKIEPMEMLYIVIEETDPDDIDLIDASMKRLPTFGLQYQDPDEETYIDKLRKEM